MIETQTQSWEELFTAGRQALELKRYADAEQAFSSALEMAEDLEGSDSRLSISLNALARVYSQQRRFLASASLLQRLLAIKERELGDQHPQLAGVLSNLAEMYAHLGEAGEELELRERILRIRRGASDADDRSLGKLGERIDALRRVINPAPPAIESPGMARSMPSMNEMAEPYATDDIVPIESLAPTAPIPMPSLEQAPIVPIASLAPVEMAMTRTPAPEASAPQAMEASPSVETPVVLANEVDASADEVVLVAEELDATTEQVRATAEEVVASVEEVVVSVEDVVEEVVARGDEVATANEVVAPADVVVEEIVSPEPIHAESIHLEPVTEAAVAEVLSRYEPRVAQRTYEPLVVEHEYAPLPVSARPERVVPERVSMAAPVSDPMDKPKRADFGYDFSAPAPAPALEVRAPRRGGGRRKFAIPAALAAAIVLTFVATRGGARSETPAVVDPFVEDVQVVASPTSNVASANEPLSSAPAVRPSAPAPTVVIDGNRDADVVPTQEATPVRPPKTDSGALTRSIGVVLRSIDIETRATIDSATKTVVVKPPTFTAGKIAETTRPDLPPE